MKIKSKINFSIGNFEAKNNPEKIIEVPDSFYEHPSFLELVAQKRIIIVEKTATEIAKEKLTTIKKEKTKKKEPRPKINLTRKKSGPPKIGKKKKRKSKK